MMYSQIKSLAARIETDGLAPLQNILKKLGGWPVLEEDRWVDEEFDWIKTSSKFHNAGYSGNLILGFDVQIDLTNSSRHVIYVRIYAHIFSHFYLLTE